MMPIDVVGRDAVTAWFGGEPSFHDAEIVEVELGVGAPACVVRIHNWRTLPETDEAGHYRTDRHAIVGFLLDGLVTVELRGWMTQNVLFDLKIRRCADGYALSFDSCVGLEGEIVARDLRVEIAPWAP